MSCTESDQALPVPTPAPAPTTQLFETYAESDSELPTPTFHSQSLSFARRKGHYHLTKQSMFKNSLLAGVGYLELANAGDFAANVWNEIPVPHFAIPLMAIGGTLALSISYFAFYDARLSWRNILLLGEERRYLRMRRAYHIQDRQIVRTLDSLLDVNFRETGTELVDRIGMDIFMGFGAIMVGIGTFLAIGGAIPSLYKASNLLSGYIGNAPTACYGAANAAWSIYVWRRVHRHNNAGVKELPADVGKQMTRRANTIKIHATMNGITGFVGGVGSLISCTKWWGYVILAPCIVSSIYCNYIWRRRIGYDRPSVRQMLSVDKNSLIEELTFLTSAQQILEDDPLESLHKLVSSPESISFVIEFIVENGLFEDFCIRLLEDPTLPPALFGVLDEKLVIDSRSLLIADGQSARRLREIAQTCVNEKGLIHFQDRERYLLETLGCILCQLDVNPESKTSAESAA